jgi:hypothetical protein
MFVRHPRSEQKADLIDKSRLNESSVDMTSAFKEEASDSELLSEQAGRFGKVYRYFPCNNI